MSKKVPLSVLIPTLNEKANIERAIRSVAWASEIYVVDSSSTDGTQELATRLGAKVVEFKLQGLWPKKYNWALENLSFENEWVLILDADEAMQAGSEAECLEITTKNTRGFDGYFINRRFMFLGRWLRHSYYPNWNLRLFKHRLGRFERLAEGDTASGDIEIHEQLVLQGRAGKMRSEMDHYAFPSVFSFVDKHNRYSNWEARVAHDGAMDLASILRLRSGHISFRRMLRVLSLWLPFRPFLRFLFIYFFQGGFLDGKPGYYFARLHQFYEFISVCKLHELRKKREKNPCGN